MVPPTVSWVLPHTLRYSLTDVVIGQPDVHKPSLRLSSLVILGYVKLVIKVPIAGNLMLLLDELNRVCVDRVFSQSCSPELKFSAVFSKTSCVPDQSSWITAADQNSFLLF